jgi:hypothetical protein
MDYYISDPISDQNLPAVLFSLRMRSKVSPLDFAKSYFKKTGTEKRLSIAFSMQNFSLSIL